MISTGFMVMGSNMLQSHLLSTTTMKRLLLGICWITKDLPEGEEERLKCDEGLGILRAGFFVPHRECWRCVRETRLTAGCQ